jgi:hypothetical protein
MAQIFTIEKIEGNSNIGVPVFSRFGQMQNYNFIALSPQRPPKPAATDDLTEMDRENLKFQIKPALKEYIKEKAPKGPPQPNAKADGRALTQL